MKRGRFLCLFVVVAVVIWGCKGPEGPVGPAGPRSGGSADLSDPSIMPKVIYTYPPANSQGPYTNFNFGYNTSIQFRFNKYMDVGSVRRAIDFGSEGGGIGLDKSSLQSIGGDVYVVWLKYESNPPPHRWGVGNRYHFSIDSTARDINGNQLFPSFWMSLVPEPLFRITAQYPENGRTNVYPYGTRIDLYFNSPVDTSIYSSIQVDPPANPRWSVSSYDSSSVSAGLLDGLKAGTTYTVRLNTSAHDVYGNGLPQTYTASFTTLPFQVTSTSPTNGSTVDYLSVYMFINFSDEVDTSTIRSGIRIQPPIAGNAYMEGHTTYVFHPSNNFAMDTAYIVSVDTSIRSKRGDRLAFPYAFSFRTPAFSVEAYPGDGDRDVARSASIDVYANASIDSSTIRNSFQLTDSSGVIVPGTFQIYTLTFSFHPTAPLNTYAIYNIHISTGLSAAGGWHLKFPYTATFRTSY